MENKIDKIYPFSRLMDDLYSEIPCVCNRKDLELPCVIKLFGHYNDHFFDVENAERKIIACPHCDKEWAIKWTRAGVCVWESGLNEK